LSGGRESADRRRDKPGLLGGSLELRVGNVAPGAQPFLFPGVSSTAWVGGALPFPLAVSGRPSYFLRVSPDVASPALSGVQVAVLNMPPLIGATLYVQALTIAPPVQLALSARGDAQIGAR
jgi:hypothetical protein